MKAFLEQLPGLKEGLTDFEWNLYMRLRAFGRRDGGVAASYNAVSLDGTAGSAQVSEITY